jgi:prepilin-type N-terminal cleavage/methylation domain-containing protein
MSVLSKGRRPRRTYGLSLVELLTVLAIIGLLSAIIFAVSTASVGAAKKASCLSNLSQIGKALKLYTEGYDGWLPPYDLSNALRGNNVVRGKLQVIELTDAIADAAGSRQILRCPADHRDHSSWPRREEAAVLREWSYTWGDTVDILRDKDTPILRLNWSEVEYPSEGELAADAVYHDDRSPHGEWVNEVFFDLHTKPRTLRQPSGYLKYIYPDIEEFQ